MNLVIFNGSPRGKNGNTSLLLKQFLKGFTKNPDNSIVHYYLRNRRETNQFVHAFKNAETVMLAFPLYSDAMPSIVKEFIEALEPLCGKKKNPKMAFFVHSGFPEGRHTLYVERYLIKLAARLGCEYIGTIRKGGTEGIRKQNDKTNAKLFSMFEALGSAFGTTGRFQENIAAAFKKPDVFPKFIFPIFKAMQLLGIIDKMWNRDLKANKAYRNRFDKPYA